MSTLHATLNTRDTIQVTRVRSPLEAFDAMRNAAMAFAARLSAGIQHRWTMRTLDRFSDRRLHDLGFERDWDGSLIPIVDDGEASRWTGRSAR